MAPARPASETEPFRRFVLTKGWHDAPGIDGVFGPYSEAEADWLLAMMDPPTQNWQKHELQRGPWPR